MVCIGLRCPRAVIREDLPDLPLGPRPLAVRRAVLQQVKFGREAWGPCQPSCTAHLPRAEKRVEQVSRRTSGLALLVRTLCLVGWAREWMGIEPTRSSWYYSSTALKAAVPTRRTDTPRWCYRTVLGVGVYRVRLGLRAR